MKKNLFAFGVIILSIFSSTFLLAQDKAIKNRKARFPGGEFAQAKFISDSLILPQAVLDGKIGSIIVKAQVDTSGKLTRLKVLKSFNSEYNAEALRVIAAMPKWEVALKNGESIKEEILIAVPFYKQRDFDFQYKKALEYFEAKKYLLAQISITEAVRRFPDNIEYLKLQSSICSVLLESNQTCENLYEQLNKFDVDAVFPGGEYELINYIAKFTKYPSYERMNGIQGKVDLTFIVDERGNVIDVDIVKGVSANIDFESIKVISNLPKYVPAIRNGVPVPERQFTNVGFKLF